MTMPSFLVDAALAEKLVREQHPDLLDDITWVVSGWDNAMFRLGEGLAIRIPRRVEAAQLMLNEQRWLAIACEGVSARTPVPVRIGTPTDYFPWSWSIVPWFEGDPAILVPPAERIGIATDLADFFAELHRPAPIDAPANPVRGVPLRSRAKAVAERLSGGLVPHSHEVGAVWSRLVGTPAWNREPVWIHGDPHPGNLVVRRTSPGAPVSMSAVVDFGDMTAGDAATDLAAAWLVFDEPGRDRFRGRIDDVTRTTPEDWRRGRAWALVMATAVVANSQNDPRLVDLGTHAIEQVLQDD
jgi:aminoglycoside phosphotransferase (APT) family kinase protein